eukprot:CAMPEP_0204570348 /NCGR_PEP_ID=MMETSP0661-20131031/38266_1 /ASSEMBLY_ACC=CAM_ASM_000606 /TAXON_ID=109239 /ORGANISM="Alexandrium margalefi, Strain AMGDE01CS-322" /LENGTH=465 /DNA_ID=CAMNT_0051578527 /DNA_START=48 /DNA_END=1443 /DNA_ORIENTATION=+
MDKLRTRRRTRSSPTGQGFPAAFGHDKMSKAMEEWMVHQKQMYEDHMAEQERLIRLLLSCHTDTLKHLQRDHHVYEDFKEQDGAQLPSTASLPGSASAWSSSLRVTSRTFDAPSKPVQPLNPPDDASAESLKAAAEREEEPRVAQETRCSGPTRHIAERAPLEEASISERVLDTWVRSSGLHTVSKWVTNYRKHPAGWGALLAILGIPEVTARLRSKVDNYSIYSALFLSMSITLVTDAPDSVTRNCGSDWECSVRKRLYALLFAVGTAAHMLSILIGMGFNNALNEAARDSDVFRIFARGKGFVATVKCERAFMFGCCADFLALTTAISIYTSWYEAFGVVAVLTAVVISVHTRTVQRLFTNGSICRYWREELGGKPDEDDPYDLQVAMDLFGQRVRFDEEYFQKLSLGTLDLAAGQDLREEIARSGRRASEVRFPERAAWSGASRSEGSSEEPPCPTDFSPSP